MAIKKKAHKDKKDGIRVHLNSDYFGKNLYVFTKDPNHCIALGYDPVYDFGKGSPSGAVIAEVEVHTNNVFIFNDKYKEISLSEVPECIIELLTYLN